MSRAVLAKTARDAWLLSAVLTTAILLLEIAVVRMLIEAGQNLEHVRIWLEWPLVRDLIRIALGADLIGDLTPTTMATFGLAHPLLYVFGWTLLLTIGTGVLAGEIDRGTADLLLTLPLSRSAIYLSTSAVWLGAAVVVSAAPLAGLWLGQQIWPGAQPLEYRRLWPLAVNLLALNLAVAGICMFVSSLSARRGKAVGIVLAVLLVSDLVNIFSQFWPAIRPISFLGFLHYYRPLPVVRSAAVPLEDIATLGGVAVAAWLAGLLCFRRRDIPAV